jgi:hypothetical protein
MKTRTIYWLFAGVALTVAGGCSSQSCPQNSGYMHGENYVPDGTYRDEEKFIDITVANGARADGTLRQVHFTGETLNSLGEKKLDNMLEADTGSATALTVYIDIPRSDPAFDKRQETVGAYLKSKGLKDSQIVLLDGPNLKYSAPAAPGDKALDTFNSTDGVFTASDSGGGGGSSSSSSSSSH